MIADILAPFQYELFTLFGAATSVAEVLGFLTGLACVWLVVRQNIWTFPIAIANAVFFGLIFFEAKLYADGTLQLVYLVLSVLGWWAWLKAGPNRTELHVSYSKNWLLGGIIGTVVGTAILVPILNAVGDVAPFWDALTTAGSLAATALMSFKKIQNWYFWLAVDVIYVPLYISKGLTLTSLVYVIFFVMSVIGLVQWRRAHRLEQAGAQEDDEDMRALDLAEAQIAAPGVRA